MPNDPILMPVQVGASVAKADIGMQRDDQLFGKQCENISAKNASYCELTALFWAWKNLPKLTSELTYVGINHYRRFFCFERAVSGGKPFALPEHRLSDYRVDSAVLSEALQNGSVIVASPIHLPVSVFDHYAICHSGIDLRELIRVVHELDSSYDDPMFEFFFNGNVMSAYNMGIMSWSQFDLYCTWLFRVLEEVELRVRIEAYDSYQKRIFGFMAERLWNVWLIRNHASRVCFPIYEVGSDYERAGFKRAKNVAKADYLYRMTRRNLADLRWEYNRIIQGFSK